MKIVQLNQYFKFAKVYFAEACVSCVSSKNNLMESMTYLRKFFAKVVCIPVRGIERDAPSGRVSLFGIRKGSLTV